jgi:MFS superfamily sulfate permease-like transporter
MPGCDYFKARALNVAETSGPGPRWFVVDEIPISQIDITGLYVLRDLRERLEARGTVLVLAGRKAELLTWLRRASLY